MTHPIAAYYEPSHRPPDERTPDSESWYAVASNFVVVMTRAAEGAVLTSSDVADEHCVVLPTGNVPLTVKTGEESVHAEENSLVIVPPGTSTIEVEQAGWVYRVFSCHCDVYARAAERDDTPRTGFEAAPLIPGPDPVGGFRLRHHRLADYEHLDGDQRIFRTTNMMIKLAPARDQRRPPTNLSPHSHDAFEQASLVVHGEWIHHLRFPWGKDRSEWRDDEHVRVGSPSVTIMPVGAIHTSQSVGPKWNQLIDIFAPPRLDFARSGRVTNADEYPLADEVV